MTIRTLRCFAVGAALLPLTLRAQTPEWIWHPDKGQAATNGETRLFRKTFTLEGKVNKAVLSVAADNRASVTVNQSPSVVVNGFERATRTDVTSYLHAGENQLTIQGFNETAIAGLLVRLEISLPNRQRQVIVSDTSWEASPVGSTNWVKAASLGKLGIEPWGDPLKSAHATTAESLAVPPGSRWNCYVRQRRTKDRGYPWRLTTRDGSSFRPRMTSSHSCASR